MVAVVVGGESGGVEASSLRASVLRFVWVVERAFSGEIFVGSAETDGVPPLHHPFLKGVVATLRPPPFVCRGGILGPVRWSGQ